METEQINACDKHPHSDVMPLSGRCRECIEESNLEARPYLKAVHNLAEGCREMNKYLRDATKSDTAISHT